MVTELLTSSASNSIDHREKGGDVPDGHMHDMDDANLDKDRSWRGLFLKNLTLGGLNFLVLLEYILGIVER